MARDNSAQSSIVSWRVSGRSAITCSVGSDLPPIIATRTRSSPSALAAGSISLAMAFVSVKRLRNFKIPLAAGPTPARPQRLDDVEESEGDIGAGAAHRKR